MVKQRIDRLVERLALPRAHPLSDTYSVSLICLPFFLQSRFNLAAVTSRFRHEWLFAMGVLVQHDPNSLACVLCLLWLCAIASSKCANLARSVIGTFVLVWRCSSMSRRRSSTARPLKSPRHLSG